MGPGRCPSRMRMVGCISAKEILTTSSGIEWPTSAQDPSGGAGTHILAQVRSAPPEGSEAGCCVIPRRTFESRVAISKMKNSSEAGCCVIPRRTQRHPPSLWPAFFRASVRDFAPTAQPIPAWGIAPGKPPRPTEGQRPALSPPRSLQELRRSMGQTLWEAQIELGPVCVYPRHPKGQGLRTPFAHISTP